MPNRFIPINGESELQPALNAINNNFAQLDNENVTKAFRGPSGNSIVQGKLPYGGYGQVIYNPSDGKAAILLGTAPKDGHPGLWITKNGFDVIDELD